MATRKRVDIQEANEHFMGRPGAVYESGTTAITGTFWAIQCLTDTVFSLLTAPDLTGDTITGVTFTAGTILYLRVTAFTLTSGSVLAYKIETDLSI